MATNTEIKNLIDSDITNKTTPSSITNINVGENMKSIVDYIDQQVGYYKSYVVSFSQSGTNAPVVTIIYNDLGTVTWVRDSVGNYTGTLAIGTFSSTKTFIPQKRWAIFANPTSYRNVYIQAYSNLITVTHDDGTNGVDGLNIQFEVRIYN